MFTFSKVLKSFLRSQVGLLELLVREVDAQLLEGVHLEALEAEDVQHAADQLHVRLIPAEAIR